MSSLTRPRVGHPINLTGVDHAAHATSFDRASDPYRRARPEYPADAIGWLVPRPAARVLDLGAGTGKLTRGLVAAGHDVVAVEPLDRMRDALMEEVPQARVLAGGAERIPLPDGNVDAVTVAQAWHWFDEEKAAAEIARVLRPGGTLGVVWNIRDASVAWVDRLSDLLGRAEHAVEPNLGGWFEPTEAAEFRQEQELDLPMLLDLVRSRSSIILLGAEERDRLLADLAELTRTHPQLAGRERFTLPYRTCCWRATRT